MISWSSCWASCLSFLARNLLSLDLHDNNRLKTQQPIRFQLSIYGHPTYKHQRRDSPQLLSAQDFNIGAALFDFWRSERVGFKLGVIKGYLEQKWWKLGGEIHGQTCLAYNWSGLKTYFIGFAQEINRVFSLQEFCYWEDVIESEISIAVAFSLKHRRGNGFNSMENTE